jgi:hypothetical protein
MGHFRRYTLRTIEAILRKAGFAVEYPTYFFGLLPPAILLQRSLPYRLGIRFNRVSLEQQARAQHEATGGRAGNILAPIFDREVLRIRDGKRLHFGSSCLAVARIPARTQTEATGRSAPYESRSRDVGSGQTGVTPN